MRIAIPQYKGTVSGAYELSQSVSLHDLDFQDMSSQDVEMLVFPSVADSFDLLVSKEVDAVLVGAIDDDNAEAFSEKGIHVFTGAGEMSPSETVEQFMKLMIDALQRRGHGGGCCGGHGGCGGESDEDDHECCGGKGHDDGSECCGGKGHDASEGDSHECCGRHKH